MVGDSILNPSYLLHMVKLKNLVIENTRLTLRNYDGEIKRLETEWDRLDSMGTQTNRQQEISKQIGNLKKQKEKWEKLYMAANEGIDAPPPAQYQQTSNTVVNSDFLKFMMSVENAELKGRDPKTKTWRPHVSPEGGLETVGYGHKLNSWAEVKKHTGISDKDVVKLLRDDLIAANKKVHQYIESHYGAKILLSQKQDEMLTELAFNLGGLEKFPRFTDAVLRNNFDVMKQEFKRSYTLPSGERKSLERRNKLFYDRYLK